PFFDISHPATELFHLAVSTMRSFGRRKFLSLLPAAAPLLFLPRSRVFSGSRIQGPAASSAASSCWLDVCAPFIVEDDARGIHTEIILTSDTFVGARGYADGADATDYEIYLYDAAGRAIGAGGIA